MEGEGGQRAGEGERERDRGGGERESCVKCTVHYV